MLVIFCSDPFETKHVDECFVDQTMAAVEVGGSMGLIHLEALVNDHSPGQAVRMVPSAVGSCEAVYRGWMVTPSQYAELYEALKTKGIILINSPEAYRHCHWLPECYGDIVVHSARTVWLRKEDGLEIDQIMNVLKPFADGPVIVKDFVKSQKHYWHEACFIPHSSDRTAVERVVTKFIELQDEDLAGGLVFREYIPLHKLAEHSKSGMPLSEEYRVFVLNGQPIFTCNYWEEGRYTAKPPDLSQFVDVLKKVPSRFFTMDIARAADGRWIIVELGDGQVSGLQTADPTEFYRALFDGIKDGYTEDCKTN